MSKRPKLLIVDDDPDLRELVGLLIANQFTVDQQEAASGNQAAEKLAQETFDVVISDFNMPSGNGKVVFSAVQALPTKPFFVLMTSDEKSDHPDITGAAGTGYLQKPFDENEMRKVFGPYLNVPESMSHESQTKESKKEYVGLSSKTAIRLSPIASDLFVMIGPDHFVKFFNSDYKLTQADEERLLGKQISQLFIPRENLESVLSVLQKSVFESLILPEQGLSHRFELAETINDLVKMGLNGLVSNAALIEQTNKNLKTVFSITQRNAILKDLMSWVLSDKASADKTHAIVISLFCNILVMEAPLRLPKDRSALILTYAAILHDLGLSEYHIRNEWRITRAIRAQSATNKTDQATIVGHIAETKKILKGWPSCPSEVLEIIEIHHEWPTGIGFPGGLKGDKLNSLAAVFIVAHEAASMIFEHKDKHSFILALQNLEKELAPFPHLANPMKLLIENLKK